MRKFLFIAGVLILFVSTAVAQAPKFGVGAFGGINIPVVQDDQKSGTAFGLKAKVKLIPMIFAEPNVTFGKWGDPDPVDGLELGISGSKITSFGIDFTIGGFPGKTGLKPFCFVGIASYKVENEDTDYENSKLGLAGGLGLAYGASPVIDIEVRGKVVIAPQDDGSKKAIWILGGFNYYFGGY